MNKPKIVAMYRMKNEERWIKKSLEQTSKICDEIVVLDDGSTDKTLEICKKCEQVVDMHHQKNIPFDETRDKNILLNMALQRKPDFIFTLDGDEIVQPNAKDILFEEITILYPSAPMFEFQFLNIWDKPNQYRYDGISSNTWAKRLIRISKQPKNLCFEKTNYPKNSHCPSIPQNSVGTEESIRSRMKIFHYGKYDEKLRQQKYNFLQTLDPNNKDFDGYIHVISGEGKFSGPHGLEFKLIPNGLYYEDID